MKRIAKVLLTILALLLLIQFIGTNKVNQPVNPEQNFVQINKTPANITTMLKAACYDCHSNETVYPGYANYAPISWFIADRVNEGRKYLNFSIWSTYNQDQKNTIIERVAETVEINRMPLPSYISKHPEIGRAHV